MTNELMGRFFPGEDWSQVADRVSGIMPYEDERAEAYSIINGKKFLPSSVCLINAGRPKGGTMAACHILEVPDDLRGIFETIYRCMLINREGAGVGLDFSALAPRGPLSDREIGTSTGRASGPTAFLPLFAGVSAVVREGGWRNVALMGTLNADHPDISRFIRAKEGDGVLSQFNLSITLPHGPLQVERGVWEEIVTQAHQNGEPGVVFLDNINDENPTYEGIGPIRAVSACGEVPHYNYGSCALGSIALPHVIDRLGDWGELERVTRFAVRFLDRSIDVNHWPFPELGSQGRLTRDIGIGVMGWAGLLKREGIPFVSGTALALAEDIAYHIDHAAHVESVVLATMKGGYMPGRRRNRVLTTIAPTGTISQLAGVSRSIYPDYETMLSMRAEDHLDLVGAWQGSTDNGISYTACFPTGVQSAFVDRLYRGAYDRGLKAMSVYRDGSRKGQPLRCESCDGGACEL